MSELPPRPGSGPRGWLPAALVVVGAAALAAAAFGGRTTGARGVAAPSASAEAGPEHGLVLTRTTARYLVVMDIIAPEHMFTTDDMASMHPAAGEVVVAGRPGPIDGPDFRHVEVHVYRLDDGQPVLDADPHLTLVDHTDGRSVDVDATLMHDIEIGVSDSHYGTNTRLPAGHSFTLRVALGTDTTDFAGTLP